MKINKRVRDLYRAAEERYRRLETEVNTKLKPQIESRGWFFKARVKELESFALKLETGRVSNPSEPEDFFGCTIVVPTQAQIDDAEQLVDRLYSVKERRPPDSGSTHKEASNFVFDDLRLYVVRGESSGPVNADLERLIFEVQIKTILQYAWGVATHDLIYKTDTVSWPKERIAYQVKAMLEHAELAVAEAASLARSSSVAKQDERTSGTLKIIEQLEQLWTTDALPTDRKRLAENIRGVLHIAQVSPDQLTALIQAEIRRVGLLPSDLSPYAFVVQALAHDPVVNLESHLRGTSRVKILIHTGMDVPDWMRAPHGRIINLDEAKSVNETPSL